ncbi:MAG TPA: epoxide hydrolase [Candidatus Binataceae bacterium]|nr:epoxide hydrolase [Candidatus Binataceae bacterium]
MAHGEIRKYTISIPDEELAGLEQRLAHTRLPGEVANSGWQYGTNLAYLKELIEYWRTRYDWRAHESELNRFAHFKVDLDGRGIHFIHQPGRGPNPKPLLLVHGWPGSIYEFHKIIPMLTDPAAHGGDAHDSFTVVAPSLPGYGFSDDPSGGMNAPGMARLFHELMTEVLGYHRFGAQGGDWGAAIVSALGYDYPGDLIGIHLNLVGVPMPRERRGKELDAEEKRHVAQQDNWRREEMGYRWIQATKPQTLAYALNDSPAGLAAWIVEKFRTWSDCDGDVQRRFTKDQLLTNITIYWVTQSINSSMRLYFEQLHNPFSPAPGTRIEVPTGAALFPKEINVPPRSWAERVYNIKRWTPMPSGGHFAAMEEPAALAAEVRAFFRELA